jgi:hypothetical protein
VIDGGIHLCNCMASWSQQNKRCVSDPSLFKFEFGYDCRWGLQALYISWLIPASGAQAPATATFLSGLGFCGLEPALMHALSTRQTNWDADSSRGRLFAHGATPGRH